MANILDIYVFEILTAISTGEFIGIFIAFAVWLLILSILFNYVLKRYTSIKNPEFTGEILAPIFIGIIVTVSFLLGKYSLSEICIMSVYIIGFYLLFGLWTLFKKN
jgi:hypothetical protein